MFKEEFVSPVLFRKSLLALAITTCALPVYAQTLQLTDAGLTLERQQFSDNVEITGAMNHTQRDAEAIHVLGSDFAKDLVFNATITSSNSSGAASTWTVGTTRTLRTGTWPGPTIRLAAT